MAKANQIVQLSRLFRDPALRRIFAEAERDPPQPLAVEPARPKPELDGGAVASPDLELA